MGEFVRIDIDGGVATIRIDRPPANALARAVSLELSEAAATVTGDEAVRAVVVWGGERIFAAGADIKAMVDYGPDEIADDVGALEQACRDLEAIPKVTIAAIEGFALGGGLEVALACDLRVAAQNAKLGLPEIRLGIIPGSGGTQRLPRLIGLARARQMVFSWRPFLRRSGAGDRVSSTPSALPGEAYVNASHWAESYAAGPSLALRGGQARARGRRPPARGGAAASSARRSWRCSRPGIRRRACAPSSTSASRGSRGGSVRVRQATVEDVPVLVALFQELDRMQADWRVFTPRPGFYDEVGTKYNEALADPDTVVLVAEDEDGEVVGMAYGEARTPSRFSDERALELSGVVVRAGYRGRGVGRELVHEAARFAADRGVRWVELKTFAPNRGAMEFWEDLGFTARVVQLTSPTKGLMERLEGR